MTQSPVKRHQVSRDYLEALSDHWAGRSRTAIEHVTQTIAGSPEHSDQFPLYRLWIELLAEEGDLDALRRLSEHLDRRGQVDSQNHQNYFALRTLIFSELDEWQAVELMSEAMRALDSNSPYVREVYYRISTRTGDGDEFGTFQNKLHMNSDFLHWQMVSVEMLKRQQYADLTKILEKHSNIYAGSPLANRIGLYQAIEEENWDEAADFAETLQNRFSSHPDYGVLRALALVRAERLDESLPVLQKLITVEGEGDADLLALLGHVSAEIFKRDDDEGARERAGFYLQKAQALLGAVGFSTSYIDLDFQKIRGDAARANELDQGQEASWIVRVPQSLFFKIRDNDEDDVNYLSLVASIDAKVGQLIFVVTEEAYTEQAQWRVGAVYSVASTPQFHPINGYEVLAQLVGRTEMALKLEIDTPKRSISRSEVECFELDRNGFEQIASKFDEFVVDENSAAEIFREFNRYRQVS